MFYWRDIMKKIIQIVFILFTAITLSACELSETSECEVDEILIGETCVEKDKENEIPTLSDIGNLFELNIGNIDGWQVYKDKKVDQ